MVHKWEGGRRIPPNIKFLLRQKFVCKWSQSTNLRKKSRVKTEKGREDNLISHNLFFNKRKFSPKRKKGYTHLTDQAIKVYLTLSLSRGDMIVWYFALFRILRLCCIKV